MTEADIPDLTQLGPGITLELARGGGHVGFIEGRIPGRPAYWLEQRIPRFLCDHLPS